jgi:hypothetical protein
MRKASVGVIGCGQISGLYLANCTQSRCDRPTPLPLGMPDNQLDA